MAWASGAAGRAAPAIFRSGCCVRAAAVTILSEDRVTEGVIEEITVIRHVLGQTDWQPRRLANVRTANGPHITVGLRDDSEPGTVIALFEEGTAPFGAAKSTS